jgi:DNA helicase HerA-like ATPase
MLSAAPRRRSNSTTLPSSHAALLGREECSKVSGSNRKPPKVFVEALALPFKLVENLLEPPSLVRIAQDTSFLTPISRKWQQMIAAERGGFEPPTPRLLA